MVGVWRGKDISESNNGPHRCLIALRHSASFFNRSLLCKHTTGQCGAPPVQLPQAIDGGKHLRLDLGTKSKSCSLPSRAPRSYQLSPAALCVPTPCLATPLCVSVPHIFVTVFSLLDYGFFLFSGIACS